MELEHLTLPEIARIASLPEDCVAELYDETLTLDEMIDGLGSDDPIEDALKAKGMYTLPTVTLEASYQMLPHEAMLNCEGILAETHMASVGDPILLSVRIFHDAVPMKDGPHMGIYMLDYVTGVDVSRNTKFVKLYDGLNIQVTFTEMPPMRWIRIGVSCRYTTPAGVQMTRWVGFSPYFCLVQKWWMQDMFAKFSLLAGETGLVVDKLKTKRMIQNPPTDDLEKYRGDLLAKENAQLIKQVAQLKKRKLK